MTDLEMRLAIGELCGEVVPPFTLREEYVDDHHWNNGFWNAYALFNSDNWEKEKIIVGKRLKDVTEEDARQKYAERHFPNYPGDLNAMSEAEKTLCNNERRLYADMLVKVHPLHYDPRIAVGPFPDQDMKLFLIATMTATQRAEAFLRIKNAYRE